MHPAVQELVIGAPFFALGLILGPSFGNIQRHRDGGTLAEVLREESSRIPDPSIRIPWKPGRRSDDSASAVALLLAILFVLATLYMRYRLVVLLAVAIVAMVVALSATLSVVLMSRRSVLAGGFSTTLALLALLVASMIGFLVVFLANDPPQGGDLFKTQAERFSQERGFDSLEGIVFIIYQLFGIATYLVVALVAIAASVAVMVALNRHVGAAGDWLWVPLLQGTRAAWSGGALGLATFCTAVSIAGSGGWLWSLVNHMQDLGNSLPTPPSTPN